jgi:membrane fusion protein (multidrug efflux system)
MVTLAPALALFLNGCSGSNGAIVSRPPPPPQVLVSPVIERDEPIYGDWVATLDGYVNANIQPQVSGYLVKQNYREGSVVHKGQVLFEIDPRPFQAALDQTRGQLAQAKGQLAQAQAQLGLAIINVRRDTPLAAARAIAQSQLDNDIQAQAQNEAQVKAAQANIQSNEAAVEQAALNVGFTHVRSLIDGIAGIATTQIGNLVGPSTVLTAVSQVNPIKAVFSISEQEYMTLAGRVNGGGPDLLRANSPIPLRLTLASEIVYGHAGRIAFADRQVNTQTGAIRIVGAFPNPGNVLRPGQFGRIRAMIMMRKNALLVPQRAVTELQGRYLVAVVGAANRVSIRRVQVSDRVGGLWIVNGGLHSGELVVTQGTAKVRDGLAVTPKPDPDSQAAAEP